MLKKCFLYFLTFILIASSCAVAFSSFALETVSLPFPSPEKFDDCPVIVYERSDGQYYMIVLTLPERAYFHFLGDHSYGDYHNTDYKVFGQSTTWYYNDNKIKVSTGLDYVDPDSDTSSFFTPIIYYYNPSNGYYNIQVNQGSYTDGGVYDVLNVGSDRTISEVIAFNGSTIHYSNDSGLRQHNKQFVFSGELNAPDMYSYLLQIDNSLKVAMQSIQTLQNSQNSKFTRFISEYVAMNTKLSSIDTNLKVLVDSMTEEHSAPQTTVNSAVSDYNSAESQVGSQHFNALDNFNVPDFSSSLGEGVLAALSFLSVQLEDFTGNGTGMTGGAIKKIASVIFIVLMLGLVTLILAMNRRTD